MVRASLRDDLGEREVCLIDISTRGMLATAARPPQRGEIVELRIGCNTLTAQVRWASQRRFGVGLRERVSVAALVEGGQKNAQLQRSVAVARRNNGLLASLRSNPETLGRLGQFVTFGALAAAAGYLIVSFSGEGLGSVQHAMSVANTAGGT